MRNSTHIISFAIALLISTQASAFITHIGVGNTFYSSNFKNAKELRGYARGRESLKANHACRIEENKKLLMISHNKLVKRKLDTVKRLTGAYSVEMGQSIFVEDGSSYSFLEFKNAKGDQIYTLEVDFKLRRCGKMSFKTVMNGLKKLVADAQKLTDIDNAINESETVTDHNRGFEFELIIGEAQIIDANGKPVISE